jgi:hypothetical protein
MFLLGGSFVFSKEIRKADRGEDQLTSPRTTQADVAIFFRELRAPQRGTPLSLCVFGAERICIHMFHFFRILIKVLFYFWILHKCLPALVFCEALLPFDYGHTDLQRAPHLLMSVLKWPWCYSSSVNACVSLPCSFAPSQILADERARGVARLEGAIIIQGFSLSLRLWPARLFGGGFPLDFRLHQRDGTWGRGEARKSSHLVSLVGGAIFE